MFRNLRSYRDFTTQASTTLEPETVPDYASLPDPAEAGVIYETLDDNRLYMWDEASGQFIKISSPNVFNLVSYIKESVDVTSKIARIDVETGELKIGAIPLQADTTIDTIGGFNCYEERNYFWNGERVETHLVSQDDTKIELNLTDIILDFKIHKNDRLIIT